jgi:glycosyltransferase involved in cell wall biosynthesis
MKVLQILPTIDKNYGGPIVVVEEITNKLREKSVKIDIFPINAISNFITRIFLLIKLIPQYDLIHIHCIWSLQNTVASFIARMFSIPYILTPHGMLDRWSLKQKSIKKYIYYILIEKYNFKNAKFTHFLNLEELNESKDFFNFKKIIIIPNGSDIKSNLENISHLNPRIDDLKNNNKIILLYLGRLHPKKGLDDLLKSFSQVIKINPNFHLLVAGGGDELYINKLKNLLNRLAINDYVSFLGPIYGQDKLFLLKKSNIFILPSYQEGDSVAIKEAMSFYVPVIITKACHFEEVEINKAGKIVSNDLNELKNAILFFSDENIRQLYGSNGFNLIANKYTWEIVANEYYKLYNSILNG